MEFNEVFESVKEAISESCGIESEKITKEKTIFDELGITSVDLVDILFTVEMEYDISLKIRDFEKDAKKFLNGKKYKTEKNILTDDALEAMKQIMPEIKDKLKPGISEFGVIKLLTVESLVNMVIRKIDEK